MKKSKFLLFSLPLLSFSFISSCSCSNQKFIINYGDIINCLNKNQNNFHSLREIQDTIKQKAIVSPIVQIDFSSLDWHNLSSDEFYYELIASLSINKNSEFILNEWTWNDDNKLFTLMFDHEESYKINDWKYININNKVFWRFNDNEQIDVQSYMYNNAIIE